MKKEKINEFSFRVCNANKTELVVISYDIVLEDIKEARELSRQPDSQSTQGIMEYKRALSHSLSIMNEIMGSLDYSQQISFDLLSLYRYVNKQLVKAMVSMNVDTLDEAEKVLVGLRSSFVQVAAADTSGAVMRNTQSTVAGATYGRNAMDSLCFNINASRGFTA